MLLSALFPLLSQLQSQVALLICDFELRISQTNTFPEKTCEGSRRGVAEPPDDWEPQLQSQIALLSCPFERRMRVSWASCGSLAASQNPLALCIKSGGDQGARANGSGPWGQQKKR